MASGENYEESYFGNLRRLPPLVQAADMRMHEALTGLAGVTHRYRGAPRDPGRAYYREKLFLMMVPDPQSGAVEVRIHMQPHEWPEGDDEPFKTTTNPGRSPEREVRHFWLRDASRVGRLLELAELAAARIA